jgi:hypothetical protein
MNPEEKALTEALRYPQEPVEALLGETPDPVVSSRMHIAPPTVCPNCGLTADNGVIVRSELTTNATYCCTNGHLYSVTWMEDV